MSHNIAGFDVDFVPSKHDFHDSWSEFNPSVRTLPRGWQREPGHLALREAIIWEKDVPIPLRDGAILRADIFRPAAKDGEALPALVAWSPYGKNNSCHHGKINFDWVGVPKSALSGLEKFEAPDPADWCARGYAVVQPDARGSYNSEGDIFVYGTQEGRDGHDTIEWIAEQKWSNGSVALVGNSWLATTQWFIAAQKPPHLKAIAPWEGLGDFYRESICRGGIPNDRFWDFLMNQFEGKNLREDVPGMVKKYPLMNAYWEDKKPQLQRIQIPMYVLASYSTGLHTEGSIRGWKYTSSTQKWLRIHPTQEWFDIYQPEMNDDLQRFLDYFLLNKNNGWDQTPKVRLSLLRYNRPPITSRAEDNYPPSRVRYETLYLDARNGALVPEIPDAGSTSYQSDSWDDDGAHFIHKFDHYTELIGHSKVKLYMSCDSLDDMDVYVILRKLNRDGQALLNCNIPLQFQKPGVTEEDIPDENITKYVGPSGRLRASKRAIGDEPGLTGALLRSREPTELWHPHNRSEKVPIGEIVELEIGIWPGGIVFEEGEAIRLEIKGHDPILPEFPPLYRAPTNLNQGRHTIYTSNIYKSAILLPLTTS